MQKFIPIDLTTGLQCGEEAWPRKIYVVKGYLVTLANGMEARLEPDEAHARIYAQNHRAVSVEKMFVERDAES